MPKSSPKLHTFLILQIKKRPEDPVFCEDTPFSQRTSTIEAATQAEGENGAAGAMRPPEQAPWDSGGFSR